jgi:hypothetical protein
MNFNVTCDSHKLGIGRLEGPQCLQVFLLFASWCLSRSWVSRCHLDGRNAWRRYGASFCIAGYAECYWGDLDAPSNANQDGSESEPNDNKEPTISALQDSPGGI